MDSLFHGLWLVFSHSPVNISACRLSALHSPLCSIDLFLHSSARTTSVPGKPSITEFNTVQIAHFRRNFFIFLQPDGLVCRRNRRVASFIPVYPEQLGTKQEVCCFVSVALKVSFTPRKDNSCYISCGVEKDNAPTSLSCGRDGKTSSPARCTSCVLHPGLYSSHHCGHLPHCRTRFQTQTVWNICCL